MSYETYSPPQVARMIGVHPNTVRRWIEEGALTGRRVRDRAQWRIYREDLEEFCQRSGFRLRDEQSSA